jgi:hypothetical protein
MRAATVGDKNPHPCLVRLLDTIGDESLPVDMRLSCMPVTRSILSKVARDGLVTTELNNAIVEILQGSMALQGLQLLYVVYISAPFAVNLVRPHSHASSQHHLCSCMNSWIHPVRQDRCSTCIVSMGTLMLHVSAVNSSLLLHSCVAAGT